MAVFQGVWGSVFVEDEKSSNCWKFEVKTVKRFEKKKNPECQTGEALGKPGRCWRCTLCCINAWAEKNLKGEKPSLWSQTLKWFSSWAELMYAVVSDLYTGPKKRPGNISHVRAGDTDTDINDGCLSVCGSVVRSVLISDLWTPSMFSLSLENQSQP